MAAGIEVASPEETLADLITKGGAGYTVIRHVLTQYEESGTRVPGVLGKMVTARKRRALQLYLLLLTVWPWLKGQERPLSAAVWARALRTSKGRRWSTTNVSDAWRDLEDLGLISRRRLARGVVITPRREDAREEYVRPAGAKNDRNETYFSLPPAFWSNGWFEKLSMPGLAMLLIVASRTSQDEEAWLTNKDAARWYGLSPRSVEAGLTELANAGLAVERTEWVKAPLSPIGATERHLFSLTGPFSTAERLEMQAKAKLDRDARVGVARTKKASAKKTSAKKKVSPKKTVLKKKVASTDGAQARPAK